MSDAPKLSVRAVSKTFEGGARPVSVVEGVSFDVREGELVALIGPSGCGKSTLLNMIGGFLHPTSGAVVIDGEPVTRPDRRRIFVFQERGVFPWLTVEENIGFGLSALPAAERRRRIAHHVALVGLGGFEHAHPSELSGGMKQRVELARALAVEPDVLYLDEPFGALDALTRLVMRAELLRIWAAQRRTILLVTHDIDEAVQLADRVEVMTPRPGRIRRSVAIDLPRPRDPASPRYLELRATLLEEIGLARVVQSEASP